MGKLGLESGKWINNPRKRKSIILQKQTQELKPNLANMATVNAATNMILFRKKAKDSVHHHTHIFTQDHNRKRYETSGEKEEYATNTLPHTSLSIPPYLYLRPQEIFTCLINFCDKIKAGFFCVNLWATQKDQDPSSPPSCPPHVLFIHTYIGIVSAVLQGLHLSSAAQLLLHNLTPCCAVASFSQTQDQYTQTNQVYNSARYYHSWDQFLHVRIFFTRWTCHSWIQKLLS